MRYTPAAPAAAAAAGAGDGDSDSDSDEDEEDEEDDVDEDGTPKRADGGGGDGIGGGEPAAGTAVFNSKLFKYTSHNITKEQVMLAVARQVHPSNPGGFNMSALLKDLKLPVGAGTHLRTWYLFAVGKQMPQGVRGRRPNA
jgi:hypothetical protein